MKGFSEARTSTGEPEPYKGGLSLSKKERGEELFRKPFSLTFYDTKHRIPASAENRET